LRCKKITQSLLDFSRTSGGKFQPLALNEVIAKTLAFIEHELYLQNVAIVKDLHEGLPQIFGDTQLLGQVIYNMVINAKWAIQKKSARAGGTITIRTRFDEAAAKISLIISDTGCGISQANLARLFEPFFTTKEVGEGTGLGLPIAFNIVKTHGGAISVESKEDAGTSFIITLPATHTLRL
jgi:signal transduction histidine kinase